MKHLKIRIKMILCFGVILVLLTAMNGGSLVNLRQISNMSAELFNGPYLDSVASVALGRELYRMDGLVKAVLLDGGSGQQESYNKARAAADADLTGILDSSPESASDVSAVQSALTRMDSAFETIAAAAAAGREDEARRALTDFSAALTDAQASADRLAVTANTSAGEFVTAARERTDLVILFQDLTFVLILLACVGAALKLSADVSRPVKKLAAGMDKIAEGQLSTRIDNENRDELGVLTRQLNDTIGNLRDYVYDISDVLGQLGEGNLSMEVTRAYIGDFGEIKVSLNRIVDSLNRTMTQIKECCGQVRGGSDSLAVSASNLAQGAEEQTAALEEFQKSLGRVAELTAQDGENAAKVKNLSLEAAETVTIGDKQMQAMAVSMGEINASSKEIAKIIKIIEDIAFQTNILALNAAVEAARAGSAGKGFAVVADEVRNLASKSAEAAKNTTAMIGKAVQAVDEGIRNADTSASTMLQIKECVGRMAALLEEIDKSTAEQGEAFGRMTASADQISSVVHLNSAAAEENSAAAEELSSQAELLDGLVARFRLRDGERSLS